MVSGLLLEYYTLHAILTAIREFSENELSRATNGYKERVGKGAFGTVFKGTLQHTTVAIKVLDPVRSFASYVPIIAMYYFLSCILQILLSDVTQSTFSNEIHALLRCTLYYYLLL